ncbi:MAG: DUF4065 domain-containing protein [Desulfovibrio sp.]|jgi:uncharacterized phage-associated protein|nr:DUF4065 domain-containing protein [Desulfovibrio sp.]
MATCFELAEYFLANPDKDEGVSNLKLQKLCAYAQAFSLALLGSKLFEDNLEAWTHGPVVPRLYDYYRCHGKNPLPTDVLPEEARRPFSDEELFILETVNNFYGRYAAWTLRDMSHNDFPGDFNSKDVIPVNDIRASFADNKIVRSIQEAYGAPVQA